MHIKYYCWIHLRFVLPLTIGEFEHNESGDNIVLIVFVTV